MAESLDNFIFSSNGPAAILKTTWPVGVRLVAIADRWFFGFCLSDELPRLIGQVVPVSVSPIFAPYRMEVSWCFFTMVLLVKYLSGGQNRTRPRALN